MLLMLLLPPSYVMVMYKVTITLHALMQTITNHQRDTKQFLKPV